MIRVFSSANSNPNFLNRSVKFRWNSSASRRYWKFATKSSANLVRYASPWQVGLIFFSNQRSRTKCRYNAACIVTRSCAT